MNNGAVH